jgi:hypothetical protein
VLGAESGDEAVCELLTQHLLEALESRHARRCSLDWISERSDIGQKSEGPLWSHLADRGGLHETKIGDEIAPRDPWRE